MYSRFFIAFKVLIFSIQLLDHFWESMRLQVDETDCPAESNVLPEAGASTASMSARIVAARTHAFTPADLLTLSRNGIPYTGTVYSYGYWLGSFADTSY